MTRAKDISKIVTDADLSGTLDVTGAVTAGGLTMDTGGNSTHTLEFGANRTSDSQALGIIKGSWNSTVVSQINLSAGDDTTNKDNGQIFFRTAEAGTTANRLRIEENGDISFYEDTGTTAKLFWDASAESLGIGTSSPANTTHVKTDTDGNGITIQRNSTTAGTYGQLGFIQSTNDAGAPNLFIRGYRGSSFSDNFMTFGTGGSGAGTERMRIDSVGNLLVASTSAANSTAGFRAYSGGNGAFTSSATSLSLNRLSSDGEILAFQKDTATVGSIGTKASDLYIGTTNGADECYLRFAYNGERIIPSDASGSANDAALDLGDSPSRFKDLYLSGGVYLGGTGTANKLDDYEEGTWTPTAQLYSGTMTVNSATYTKIGNLVTLKASVTFDATTDSSGVSIQSIPFAHTGANKGNGGFVTASTVASASKIDGVGSGTFSLKDASGSAVTYTTMASTTLDFCISYTTTS